jgi:hypothetical protein
LSWWLLLLHALALRLIGWLGNYFLVLSSRRTSFFTNQPIRCVYSLLTRARVPSWTLQLAWHSSSSGMAELPDKNAFIWESSQSFGGFEAVLVFYMDIYTLASLETCLSTGTSSGVWFTQTADLFFKNVWDSWRIFWQFIVCKHWVAWARKLIISIRQTVISPCQSSAKTARII